MLEIGAFEGDLTAASARLGRRSRGRPSPEWTRCPPTGCASWPRPRPELELIEETSHDYLAGLDSLPDAVVIDGDHNYFTLSRELELIDGIASGAEMPLLLFHDVLWPHARRDTYYAPERIPEEHRQPLGNNVGLAPGNPGVAEWGLPFIWAALEEGGPGNGTLTAIEDFMAERDGLRLAIVPAFFGFGLIWHEDAPWADAVAELIAPYDRNPVLARLEGNRVEHLVAGQGRARELVALKEEFDELCGARALRERPAGGPPAQARVSRARSRSPSGSRALRQRGKPTFSRDEVRAAVLCRRREGRVSRSCARR